MLDSLRFIDEDHAPTKAANLHRRSINVRQVRQLLFVSAAVVSMVASIVVPAAADDSKVVIEGGGWGHGIGMSQYGAYGQALDGKSGEEIVGYYYQGSSTAQIADQVGASNFLVTDPSPLWVNLLANKTVFRFEAIAGSLKACQGGECSTVEPGESWRFVAVGDGTCRFEMDGEAVGQAGACSAHVKGMSSGGSRIEVGGLDTSRDEFARGRIQVRSPNSGSTFHVSLEINLEKYLYGLAEVPFSWHPEALRAQALAGRSYAAWKLLSNGPEESFSATRKANCWCHMYATTADQSYSGWANEAVSTADRWQSAVDSTAGKVITHPDASQANIVAAFYSSSTGGRTENKADMWGGTDVSYLQSRPDPWSQDPAVKNPFARWEFPFTEADLAASFGVDKVDGMKITERFDSGTPKVVEVYTRTAGVKATINKSGPDLYADLALRGRNIKSFDYGAIPTISGDFDGDGRTDVAMATGFSNAWWVGLSSPGEFTMDGWLNPAALGEFANHIVGDFNGDGRDDIATMQVATGRMFVGLSTGSRFKRAVWVNHANPERWESMLVGDFDGDGSDDIAEYQSANERWRVYRLDDGELVREFWYDFTATNLDWVEHSVGDYNDDGKDDILSLGGSGRLTVLFSDGSEMTPQHWQSLPNSGAWQDLLTADFTGDGIDDLAAYDAPAATWWVVPGRNRLTARAPAAWFTFANTNQDSINPVAGDFTGDNKADIVSYKRSNGKLRMLTSSGSGFERFLWGAVPAKDRVTAIHVMDANNDGRLDIGAWDNERRRWWVARNQAHTTFDVTRWGKLL